MAAQRQCQHPLRDTAKRAANFGEALRTVAEHPRRPAPPICRRRAPIFRSWPCNPRPHAGYSVAAPLPSCGFPAVIYLASVSNVTQGRPAMAMSKIAGHRRQQSPRTGRRLRWRRACCSRRRKTAQSKPHEERDRLGRVAARIPGAASQRPSPGPRPARLLRGNMRRVLSSLGMLVMGGVAYVGFKPGPIDTDGAIADDATRKFLHSFVDRFAALMARFGDPQRAAA
jgi:hypothetical protein